MKKNKIDQQKYSQEYYLKNKEIILKKQKLKRKMFPEITILSNIKGRCENPELTEIK